MIGCLYIPDYPAWSLRYLSLQHGATHEKGLAVVEEGRVLAFTPKAKHAGVASGMTCAEAEATGASIRERDRRAEAAVWVDVMQGLNAHTPRIEPVGPGLLYFDVVDAEAVRDFIEATNVQAAYAPDRPAARLGALHTKPGTLKRLTHAGTAALVRELRVEQLLRLDYPFAMIEQLKEAGYDRLGPLQDVSRRRLQAEFGTPGKRLHRLLHPSRVDRAPVPLYTAPDTVWQALHWETPAVYWEQMQPALARLLSQAVSRLGAKTCQHVTVQLTNASTGAVQRASQVLRAPTRTRATLFPVAHALLRTLVQPDVEAETLRVVLGALAIPEVYPDVFFRQAQRMRWSTSSCASPVHAAEDTVRSGNVERSEMLDKVPRR